MLWLIAFAPIFLLSVWALITTLRGLPHFRQLPAISKHPEFSVSVISPACNEAESIEEAVSSMLSTGAEVVVVNDRSSDDTGAILERLAETTSRLKVVHNTEVPSGWLGKVHALQVGTEAAAGDWLLFADADGHIEKDTLPRALSWMDEHQVDFLSIVPKIETAGFLGDTVFSFAQTILSAGTKVWAIDDPKSRAVGATGAFMLVRKTAFERTPGFEWLRMEVADDFGLCSLIKSHGGTCALLNGADGLSLRWYASFTQMVRAMQKNFYAITGRCQPWRCFLQALILLVLGLSPLGVLAGGYLTPFAAAGSTAFIVAAVLASRKFRRPLLPACFVHLGAVLTSFIVIRAGYLGWRMSGIEWRGTHYSAEEINKGRRVWL